MSATELRATIQALTAQANKETDPVRKARCIRRRGEAAAALARIEFEAKSGPVRREIAGAY